jgi:hypothetical protein
MHNEELHNLYYSPKIIRTITSSMRWTWHAARMGAWRSIKDFCEKPRRNHWKDLYVRIILKWILEKADGVLWTGFIWLT